MISIKGFPNPENEAVRLKALNSYSILDTLPEKEYDDITMLASQICHTPISLISLIDKDRQWFKSKVGIEPSETSRKDSFCAHAILDTTEILTVKDSRKDDRFCDNPLVTGDPRIVFYTGIPLVDTSGMPLGTLCVIDKKPKELNLGQLAALKALSGQVVSLFELRKSKMMLEKLTNELEIKNSELEKFAHVAAHDIKSPLNNITGMAEILLSDYSEKMDAEARVMLGMLKMSSGNLRNLVDGILEYSKTNSILQKKSKKINLHELVDEIIRLLDPKAAYAFTRDFENEEIFVNKTALQQILINLIANAIKYNDKEKIAIAVGFSETEEWYRFYVTDNGPGISKKNQQRIFNIFEVGSAADRFGDKGTGIGLSTVKKLAEGLGGEICVESILSKGTKFSFAIEKTSFI